MTKKIVRYVKDTSYVLGKRAYLLPIDHPYEHISNKKIVATSDVVRYDEATGVIETLNTIYIPDDRKSP